jgi:hypothetical protein
MKLCIDCRFYVPGKDSATASKHSTCDFTYPDKVSPVDGSRVRQPYDFCDLLRASEVDHNCGPDARFFEARE